MEKIFDELIAQLKKEKALFKKVQKKNPALVPDISDVGNVIGFVIGNAIKEDSNINKEDFLAGFDHGISLTDGTH